MSAGDPRGAMGPRERDRVELFVVTGVAAGLTVLAVIVPASAIATGPAMLLFGLVGMRRGRAQGTPAHLLLVTSLGVSLTVTSLLAAALLVAF